MAGETDPAADLSPGKAPGPRAFTWGLLAIAAVLLLQLELTFSKSFNWDEFYHFSEIHQYLLERWQPKFQTPYVFLYWWVPSLPGDNFTHMSLVRAFILPFELVTLACIFAMARRFVSREAALLCSLAYAAGGYAFLHALAIRADMIATALLMAALGIALCRPLRWLECAAIALLGALAFVATIKSVIYFPALFGVLLLRMEDPRQRKMVGWLALALVAGGAGLLLAHPLLPEIGPFAEIKRIAAYGANSVARMFTGGLFPRGQHLWLAIQHAPVLFALIGCAIVMLVRGNRPGQEKIALWGLLFPLLSVVFYRNSFPYYYVFALAPAAVVAAPAVEYAIRRYGFLPLVLVLLANAALLSLTENRQTIGRQEVIQQGLKEIFPQPVSYIDESGMIGDYPRAIPRYASAWSLQNYRNRGVPAYSRAMEKEPVPLLLANGYAFRNLFEQTHVDEHLLPEDVAALRANYIHHWGEVFVAGKRLFPGVEPLTIDIAVPGTYTVEQGAVTIDGREYQPGQTVTLERGEHRIGPRGPDGTILRWGDHLPRPGFAWPTGPIFTDF